MTAIIVKKINFSKWLNWTFLIIGWFIVLLILVFKSFVYKSGIVGLGLNITILSVGVSLILLWMHENHSSGKEKNHIALKWLRDMGIYSYEIYLTHMFVIIFGVHLFKSLGLGANWLIPFCLLLIIISYFLGKIVFHKFSEPINSWLREKWMTRK